MPQYKKMQYGMKQYGLFLPTDPTTKSTRRRFLRARFGIVKKGKTYWLYQHTSVTIKGAPAKLRLSTNLKERISEERKTIKGRHTHIRIKTGNNPEWIVSSISERKGVAK